MTATSNIDPVDIDGAAIAVMASGAHIRVIAHEGADEATFAGELLNPTERERRGGAHWSSLWDRAQVVALVGGAAGD